jgi:hypothetical protein
VHDGIDFALSESFLRFVDNHVFDNSYLSHLVPVDAHSLFLLVFVLDLKRPDSKYPQTALQKPKCITSFLSFFTRAPTMLATPTLLEINGSDPMFPYKVRCFFAGLMSASSHFSTSKLGSLDKSRSSLVVSLFYLSRSSIENSCVVLACSLTKDPSLINALDWEFILSIITASLEKIHRVADVVFVGLSAMSLSFTHHFSGPKRRYASNWDNVCGEHIKFCIHCSSDLTSFHGTSAALKSLLPLCPGQSFYAQ